MVEANHLHLDSLASFVAGLGDPMRDKMSTASYGMQIIDDFQLLNIYRSNWLGRKIVDIPAMDAIRKGRDWQAGQDQIEAIEAEQNRLGFWTKLLETKTKARLWGGAALYIGTGDSDVNEPLDPAKVGKAGIKYLTVLTRKDMTAGPIEQDVLSEFHGKPAYYEVTGQNEMVRIHPSRLAVLIGAQHPEPLMIAGNTQGWGDSVIEAVYTAMKHADATAANIASLVFEANVDVFGVPDLMANLSSPDYSNELLGRFALAAVAKGINRALVLDANETYERKTVTFTNLPEVMQTFLQMVAGAADIPLTRLMGVSASGMNATGEGDMKNYYDRVSSIQSLELTPALYRLDECLIRSALGTRPAEVYYTWSPLEQMSEKELAEIGKMNAETAQTLATTGIYTPDELRKVVTNQMVESGFYPGLDQVVSDTEAAFDPALEGEEDDITPTNSNNVTRIQRAANDAAPRTLYVSRKVVNAADLIAWAKGQGFTTTLPAEDLHVTIAYSRQPVDWMKVGEAWQSEIKVAAGGPRLMERFGEARVLLFKSSELEWRHEGIIAIGASWDHPEYQPHITISYDPDAPNLSTIEPYQGEIVLGPELFAEVKEDWSAEET